MYKRDFYTLLFLSMVLLSCKTMSQQVSARKVLTDTVLAGIHFSNDFPAARMNSLSMDNDSTFTIGITPETMPINPSPWYAFKIWSSATNDKTNNNDGTNNKTVREIAIRLKYEGFKHRYQPKTSEDGLRWKDVSGLTTNADKNEAVFKVGVSTVPLTIAAQEIIDSKLSYQWMDSLAKQPYIRKKKIGKSVMGRPIIALNTKGSNGQKVVIVLSRQHPPEVSGYMAMQEFVRTILAETAQANQFRKEYEVFIIPMINPDGVDEGNWRHSRNGVDLNRDWQEFVQPETRAVRDYLLKSISKQNAKVYFGLDFHSTFYDVFYTNDVIAEQPTNSPGFTAAWLKEFEQAIPGFKANVKPSGNGGNVSKSWMGKVLNADAITYEVGDDTPRPQLKLKGKVAAEKMMELLLGNK